MELDVHPAQLGLSCLLHQGYENNLSLKVGLSDYVLKRLDDVLKPGLAVGANLI